MQRALLGWYNRHKRDLPWRKTHDPYSIWLSEIMLQQTTVKTVVPYYQKFLEQFPTLKSLADADEQKYLKLWAGLGYYNRIRNLHKAANIVVKEYEGVIPSSKEKLLELPGLGDYTASAVASIAFNEAVAVVDGNVMRVLARLHAYGKEIKTTESKKFFSKKANECLDKKNPGDFNQAMMELGATVCTPKNPTCLLCPVQKFCVAFKKETVEKYPVMSKPLKYFTEYLTSSICIQDDKILLRQRGKNEIMSGLWEFPLEKTASSKLSTKINTASQIKHSIMNRRYVITPQFVAPSLEKKRSNTKWIHFKKMDQYPLTTITQKIIKKIPAVNDRFPSEVPKLSTPLPKRALTHYM